MSPRTPHPQPHHTRTQSVPNFPTAYQRYRETYTNPSSIFEQNRPFLPTPLGNTPSTKPILYRQTLQCKIESDREQKDKNAEGSLTIPANPDVDEHAQKKDDWRSKGRQTTNSYAVEVNTHGDARQTDPDDEEYAEKLDAWRPEGRRSNSPSIMNDESQTNPEDDEQAEKLDDWRSEGRRTTNSYAAEINESWASSGMQVAGSPPKVTTGIPRRARSSPDLRPGHFCKSNEENESYYAMKAPTYNPPN
jgi:hypothetical protein